MSDTKGRDKLAMLWENKVEQYLRKRREEVKEIVGIRKLRGVCHGHLPVRRSQVEQCVIVMIGLSATQRESRL